MEKLDRPIQDMPQIDGLRTIAVFAAMFSHYLPWPCPFFAYGHAGVQLFYTISGFLITGILLKCRDSINDGCGPTGFYLKQFYARRFLRIFPLYYGIMAVPLVRHNLADSIPYHLTYTSNIYMAVIGKLVPAVHFWSLCVEEQFYLFWPLLVFFSDHRTFQRWVVALIPFSFLFRGFCLMAGYPEQTLYLLPANFDCLATGALLAIVFWKRTELAKGAKYVRMAGAAGIALLGVVTTISMLYPQPHGVGAATRYLFQNTVIALISANVVWHAAFGYSGIAGRLLNLAPVRYLGRISYGLYVIHLFTPLVTRIGLAAMGYSLSAGALIALNVVVTVAIASLSWHLFEAPINSLKKFFPYKHAPAAAPSLESDEASAA